MTGDRLRVGILSGVRHARQYAELLRLDDRVEIIGLAEDADAPEWMRRDSRAVATALGIPFIEGTAALLDEYRPEVALVCSEPTRHAALAVAALDRGVHTLVDKPVATTLEDARRVEAASSAASCSVINRTSSPALRRLRGWIDEGRLGLPRHLNVEFLSSGARFASSVERPELVLDPALSGGGELLNFLGYAVDAVRYLSGLEVVEVFAEASALFGLGHTEAGLEDSGVVSLLLEHGVTATVVVSRAPAAAGAGAGSCVFRVIGSSASATGDDAQPQITRFGDDDSITALPVGGDGGGAAVRRFLRDYVGSRLNGSPLGYDIADAVAAMRVIDAAYESVRTGSNVRLGS